MLNILFLYNATQTYTNTVYEHIANFGKYSSQRCFFAHQDVSTHFKIDLSRFDAVAVHYSIRLPYDQFSPSTAQALAEFKGLKFLFIQDEYDHTHKAWHWIKALGIQLVFTVVPENGIEVVYPPTEFPATKFVTNLTGYVPEELQINASNKPPSERELVIGYRGRPLPIRYGHLGREKIDIGRVVRSFCESAGVSCDIEWDEESRIYGPAWYDFMASCRSMLGSESGSNVFDWDGTLDKEIAKYRQNNPAATDEDVERLFVANNEIPGIMNQISPKLFEAVAARTVMVLYEGTYSGVLQPEVHYISVKKDGSNLPEVLQKLMNGSLVDAMAERAYKDILTSGRFSYQKFVKMIDQAVLSRYEELNLAMKQADPAVTLHDAFSHLQTPITTTPIRATPPVNNMNFGKGMLWRAMAAGLHVGRYLMDRLPAETQAKLKQQIKSILPTGTK